MQHRLGELLASACKDYARNGGCKMFSASEEGHRIRVLEFREGEKRSVIAYMLQENDSGQKDCYTPRIHSFAVGNCLPTYLGVRLTSETARMALSLS